jgi:hypothetical protein
MTNEESTLLGRAQELADRYSTSGTEELLTREIIRLVKEYVQAARARDEAAEKRMVSRRTSCNGPEYKGRRPNCF